MVQLLGDGSCPGRRSSAQIRASGAPLCHGSSAGTTRCAGRWKAVIGQPPNIEPRTPASCRSRFASSLAFRSHRRNSLPSAVNQSLKPLVGFRETSLPLCPTLTSYCYWVVTCVTEFAANSPPPLPQEPDASRQEWNGTSGGGEPRGGAHQRIHEELILIYR